MKRVVSMVPLLSVCAACASSGSPQVASTLDASVDVSQEASRVPHDAIPGVLDSSLVRDAGTDGELDAGQRVALLSHTDLPREAASQSLSGTFWDESARTLLAVRDDAQSITRLVPDEKLRRFEVAGTIALTARPSSVWDAEGLVLHGQGLLVVTVETAPLLERFSLSGGYVEAFPIPAIYSQQRAGNKGIESLAVSPSQKTLFFCNEQALAVDGAGPTKEVGTLVRLLQFQTEANVWRQFAYRTEPLGAGEGGDMGVSELVALSDSEVLVLERGYQTGFGNTVRVFRVSVEGAQDVSALSALSVETPVISKRLVVDLTDLPREGITHPGVQSHPILDNYEGMSLGPVLGDGRKTLFLTSDDNGKASQVARILVLASKEW